MKLALVVTVMCMLAGLGTLQASGKTNEYKINITVDATKANGKAWDAGGGRPDVFFIIDKVRYSSAGCRNSYRCSMTFTSKGSGPWYIEIWDKDMAANDPIGTGMVRIGRNQRIGRAKASIR